MLLGSDGGHAGSGISIGYDLLIEHLVTCAQPVQSVVTLHFRGYGEVDSRPAYSLEFICQVDKTAGCYAYRGEIWVDMESYLPTRLHIYDWDNQLYEHYEYYRLRLNPGLGPDAFLISSAERAPASTTVREDGAND